MSFVGISIYSGIMTLLVLVVGHDDESKRQSWMACFYAYMQMC